MVMLIFDFDGVIVDSFEIVHVSCAEVLAQFGMTQFVSREKFLTLCETNFFN